MIEKNICDINLWIENDPPPLWNFSKNSSDLVAGPFSNDDDDDDGNYIYMHHDIDNHLFTSGRVVMMMISNREI